MIAANKMQEVYFMMCHIVLRCRYTSCFVMVDVRSAGLVCAFDMCGVRSVILQCASSIFFISVTIE